MADLSLPGLSAEASSPEWDRGALRQAGRAIGHLRAAAGLLLRRPVLLLIPLLLVLLNAGEEALATYLIARAPGGREYVLASSSPAAAPAQPRPAARVRSSPLVALEPSFGAQYALGLLSLPFPRARLTGTQGALQFSVHQHFSAGPYDTMWWCLPFSLLLPLLLFPLGYLVVAVGVSEGRVQRRAFWDALRRFGPRLVIYQAIVIGVVVADVTPALIFASHHNYASPYTSRFAWAFTLGDWALWLVLSLLCLAPCAIALNGLGVIRALRTSVTTLLRGWPTTLSIFLAALLLSGLQVFLSHIIVLVLRTCAPGKSFGAAVASALFQHFTPDATKALLGAWLVVALFLWYAESQRRTAATATTHQP